MKLSSILSMFMLLTVYTTGLLGNGEEDFYTKYDQPTWAEGSQKDYIELFKTGICRNCNLQGFDLRKVARKYCGINIQHSNCALANLSGADLYKANLYEVNFKRANLNEAELEDVYAADADFSLADMKKAIMPKAQFYGAKFHRTNLEGANLEDAKFDGAYMDYANMKRTNIKNASFNRAYLKETNFKGAVVNEKTSFAYADCISTNFRNIVNLYSANFLGAILHRCKVSHPYIPDKIRTEAGSIIGTLIKCCSKKDILGCQHPYKELK